MRSRNWERNPGRSSVPRETRQLLEEEVFLELVRTEEAFGGPLLALFKRHGLTSQQYNVLRVLYTANAKIPLQSIGARLITRVPDVSRLIDRLEVVALVERIRCDSDSRVVFVALTDAGQQKVESVDPDLTQEIAHLGGGLCPNEQRTLIALLRKLREGVTSETEAGHADAQAKADSH